MLRRTNPQIATEACALLGIPRVALGEQQPCKARDEIAIVLSDNRDALRSLSQQPSVSLKDLHLMGLLPTRINNPVENLLRYGPEPGSRVEFFTGDIADLGEQDFAWFEKRPNIGSHYARALRRLRDIYLETNRFRSISPRSSQPGEEIGSPEQDALIERISECIRTDPNMRGTLFKMFPPGSPKP